LVFAFAALGFALLDGHTSAVHHDVQDGNLRADLLGQLKLEGAVDFFLITVRNVGSDRFRRALHCFGGDVDARQ
jgi:hypothetical protein